MFAGDDFASWAEVDDIATGKKTATPAEVAGAKWLVTQKGQAGFTGGGVTKKQIEGLANGDNYGSQISPDDAKATVNQDVQDIAKSQADGYNAVPANDPRFFNASGGHTKDWYIALTAAKNKGDTTRMTQLVGTLPPAPGVAPWPSIPNLPTMDNRTAFSTLANNQDLWKQGGQLSIADLEKIAKQSDVNNVMTNNPYNAATVAAARRVLDTPGMFNFIDGSDSKMDGSISQSNLSGMDKAWSSGGDHYGHQSMYKDQVGPGTSYEQQQADIKQAKDYQDAQWKDVTPPRPTFASRSDAVGAFTDPNKPKELTDLIESGGMSKDMMLAIANAGPGSKWGDKAVAAAQYIMQRPGMFEAIDHCQAKYNSGTSATNNGTLDKDNFAGYQAAILAQDGRVIPDQYLLNSK